MASSSVSQEDHDVEHDFAMASRRAKVRSARANRAVNSYTTAAQPLRGILVLSVSYNSLTMHS